MNKKIVETEGGKLKIVPDPSLPLVAFAFKVVHDHHMGLIVYLRIYSGTLNEGSVLINCSNGEKERATRVMIIEADDTKSIKQAKCGNICAVMGLRHTSTGDTLTLNQDKLSIQLDGVSSPAPVFFASIEPETTQYEKPLEEALQFLQREDPSFGIGINKDTHQTQISGMGELHLDIIHDRLINHYKVPSKMGAIRIAYKSFLNSDVVVDQVFDFNVSGVSISIHLSLKLEPLERGDGIQIDYDLVPKEIEKKKKNKSKEEESSEIPEIIKEHIENGIVMGCEQGVEFGIPLTDLKVTINSIDYPHIEQSSNLNNIIQISAIKAVLKGARDVGVSILEPKMKVEIIVQDSLFGSVVSDINTSRRGSVEQIRDEGDKSKTILAEVPLKEMIGYSSIFRSITHGSGNYSMIFKNYGEVDSREYNNIIKTLQGW